ncbi:MAG: DegV family protein [Eubacterium sp.]|nr:DegV family protein [Eubacterium sp.]
MIRIITDSLSDMTMEYAKANNFDIMALTVSFGSTDYKCGVDLSNEEFYNLLETSEDKPNTAAVNPYEFEQIFQKYIDAGDEIVAILFSKYMSATFQSANIAAENVNSDKLHLIDCENGAMGQALLVQTAVDMRDAGASATEIADAITALIPRVQTYFVVDNMDYLQHGGRISKTVDQVDNQARIHPVLQLLPDGVKPLDKVKGRKSANAWLVNRAKEKAPDSNYKFVIGHSNAVERAETLKAQLREAGIQNEILITCIAPIVGTHIGPYSLGIGYVEEA